jgi:hypothetical protein
VSFGGCYRESAIARKLTSAVVDEDQLGARAAELLDEMREGKRAIDDGHEFRLPLRYATDRPSAR